MHDGKPSELCHVMIFTKEFIYETQLLSAYDIYYQHMLDTMELNPTKHLLLLIAEDMKLLIISIYLKLENTIGQRKIGVKNYIMKF